ncbi:hypothetical protein ACFV9G_13620 [Nocardioides sp. NPDC059952]|uniref:hypothetical protein n=1 Tax=Nocardioides sp. NPDC059952 TaxID=3347014 RepID=UPI00365C351F
MTWVKTGTEFPADAANDNLTDAAYRTHHEVITWLYVVERMDCRIPKRLVRKVAGSDEFEIAIKELLALGWWRDRGEDFEVVHHGLVVRGSLGAQQNKRAKDRRGQQAFRDRQKDGGDPQE